MASAVCLRYFRFEAQAEIYIGSPSIPEMFTGCHHVGCLISVAFQLSSAQLPGVIPHIKAQLHHQWQLHRPTKLSVSPPDEVSFAKYGMRLIRCDFASAIEIHVRRLLSHREMCSSLYANASSLGTAPPGRYFLLLLQYQGATSGYGVSSNWRMVFVWFM